MLSRPGSLPVIPLSTTPNANSTTPTQMKLNMRTHISHGAPAQKWGISFNTEDFSSLTMTPTLPSLAVFYSQQSSNPTNKGPFLLMQVPTQHLLTKFPMFNLNTGPISANHEHYLE